MDDQRNTNVLLYLFVIPSVIILLLDLFSVECFSYKGQFISKDFVVECRKLMPPSLKRILIKRDRSLFAGYMADPSNNNYKICLMKTLKRVKSMLNGTPSFDDVAYQFGRIARFVCEINSPDRFSNKHAYFDDYSHYFYKKKRKFVSVFYDYSPVLFEKNDIKNYLKKMEDRNRKIARRIVSIYNSGQDSRTFDDRSAAFGLASLYYSHTITDIANLWLYTWYICHGDLTGVPFFQYSIKYIAIKGANNGKNKNSSDKCK